MKCILGFVFERYLFFSQRHAKFSLGLEILTARCQNYQKHILIANSTHVHIAKIEISENIWSTICFSSQQKVHTNNFRLFDHKMAVAHFLCHLHCTTDSAAMFLYLFLSYQFCFWDRGIHDWHMKQFCLIIIVKLWAKTNCWSFF